MNSEMFNSLLEDVQFVDIMNNDILSESVYRRKTNLYIIYPESMNDNFAQPGVSFGADINTAVYNYKQKLHTHNNIKNPPEKVYVYIPDAGHYDFRMSYENFNSWWSLDKVYLRMIGIIKFNEDWSWEWIEKVDESYCNDYQNSEFDILTESKIEFVNDKGEEVPKVCPKCGSKVGIFLRGEPVFLCTNKKCGKYFGTVPCKD